MMVQTSVKLSSNGKVPPAQIVPSFPGMPHFHFMRSWLPSALLSMRAKKPSGWSCRHALRSDCSLWRASDMSEEDTQLRPVLKRTGSHTVSVEIITWSDHSARGGGVTGRKHRTTLTLEKGEEALPCAPTRTFQTPASMLHHPNTMPQNFRARLQLTVACRRAPRSLPFPPPHLRSGATGDVANRVRGRKQMGP